MLDSKSIAKSTTLKATVLKFLAGLFFALCVGPVMALNLAIGSGHLITLEGEAATVFVADPEIADVQMRSAGAILVFGRRAGTTTLYALDELNKQILHQQITVRHNVGELQDILRKRFPALRLVLESAPGSLMVSGSTPDPETTEAIIRTIKPYIGENDQLISRISISSPTQVHLRVRVTEVSRTVAQRLGINWSAISNPSNYFAGVISGRPLGNINVSLGGTNSSGSIISPIDSDGYTFLGGYSKEGRSILGVIDVLDREGLINVLAEPNLTAVSGQTASFLAGGEFPVPTKQDNDSVSVEFKPFGVALDFTPTVLSNDRISIKVRPEISEIDPSASFIMDGLAIPGVSVRRVETTVEMASGQSFAIGGLLQNNVSDILSQIPGLGSLPVLGKLFSSTDYQNNKSELVIIVTPYLVRPTDPDQLTTPLATMRANSDIEEVFRQNFDYDPITGNVPRLSGNAGFVY